MPALLNVNNYHYLRGGAETVFFQHARVFTAAGWKVVPFSMKHPRNQPSDWQDYFVEQVDVDSSQSIMEKARRLPNAVYSLEARRKLSALLNAIAPDVCHLHNIYHHISPSILSLLRSRGIATVLTVHDLKLACPAYTMLTHDGICERCRGGRTYNVVVHRCIKESVALSTVVMLESVLYRALGSYRRYVNRFAVPSRFHLEKLCEWGMPRALLTHVPNFVEVDKYQPEPSPGSTFVFLGRISREKGIATLIRAAARAGCAVRVVGTGSELESMKALARTCKADVTFAGHLSGRQLEDAVRSARAVVVPSECYENAPMSVLEAYALGKPVAGARIGGIPELIREQETGLTFKSGDVEELAATLRRMADMPDDRLQEMGRAARFCAESEYGPELYRERILRIYREIGAKV